MTSDHDDASQLSDPLRRARTSLIDRSAVMRLMEEAQGNSIAHAMKTAQQQSIYATMQAIESPSTRIARELADVDRLGVVSAMRERLAMHTRYFDQATEVARLTSMAIRDAVRPWQPAISDIAKAADLAAYSVRNWHERHAQEGRTAIDAMRRIEANIGSAQLLAQQFNERLAFAERLTQTEHFRSWLSNASSDQMQDRIERLLEDAVEAEDHPELDESSTHSVEVKSAAALLSWLSECLTALRASGLPKGERIAALAALLGIVCFLYTELGSSQDHAEHMAKIDAQSQAVNAKLDEQNRSAREMVAMTQAMLALEMADHTYRVVARSAPLRTDLSEPATHWLPYGEEVQVLRAAGKWRFVQTVDENGAMFFGWVMNKHLDRVK